MAKPAGRPQPRAWRSFSVRLVVALALFAVVPALVYLQLEAADAARGRAMLGLVQEQGRLVGESLQPVFDRFSPKTIDALATAVAQAGRGGTSVKVLFRPAKARGDKAFFLVAAAPPIEAGQVAAEAERLVASGVLSSLADSCTGGSPLALRLDGGRSGAEVLTQIVPHRTRDGCWAVVTALPTGTLPERAIAGAYWQAPELRAAVAIYGLMAVLVLSIFTDAWADLRRFRAVARRLKAGDRRVSFVAGNRIPELAEVAEDIDALVGSVKRSEALLRQAAEENAHALKAPLAVIAQSLEPLRRVVPEEQTRARRCLDLIEGSVERLDSLVGASRRMDEAIAELIDTPRQPVALEPLLTRLVADYRALAVDRRRDIDLVLQGKPVVLGAAALVETIAENLLDNALDFAPEGSAVSMVLAAQGGQVVLSVADQGPGVDPADLDRIFERHVSSRAEPGGNGHFGLGLWLVRRNAEVMGGAVTAANRAGGGLTVDVRLPLWR